MQHEKEPLSRDQLFSIQLALGEANGVGLASQAAQSAILAAAAELSDGDPRQTALLQAAVLATRARENGQIAYEMLRRLLEDEPAEAG